MTREKFIKKWLGNKDYQYTEQNRDLMRNDLDEVINQALRQPPVIGMFTKEDMLDFSTDQRNRDLEPTENTLKDWVNYR